jgi:hypothetical protein
MATGGNPALEPLALGGPLTAEEEVELRRLRQMVHDNPEDPELTRDTFRRMISLQNKQYRHNQAMLEIDKRRAEREIDRLQDETVRLANELDTAERDRQERIKRRIDFDLDEDIFEPPHTSSRLQGGRC